jgi:hypothetical protein
MNLRTKHNINFGKLNAYIDSLPEEAQLQCICVKYAEENYPDLFLHHSPNEWGTTKDKRMIGNKMGVKAGFPDIMIMDKHGNIFFVELKSEKGELSNAQKELHAGLAKLGHEVIIMRKFGEWTLFLHNNFHEFKVNKMPKNTLKIF